MGARPQLDDDFHGLGGVGGCVAGHDSLRDLTIAYTTARLDSLERLDPLDEALATLR